MKLAQPLGADPCTDAHKTFPPKPASPMGVDKFMSSESSGYRRQLFVPAFIYSDILQHGQIVPTMWFHAPEWPQEAQANSL